MTERNWKIQKRKIWCPRRCSRRFNREKDKAFCFGRAFYSNSLYHNNLNYDMILKRVQNLVLYNFHITEKYYLIN